MLKPNPGRQSGFTLLEVLVAIIILGVGLLGLASLQAVGLQFNQVAHQRTQATNMAYDMVDRIRSNRQSDYTAPLLSTDCEPDMALDQATAADRDIAAWRNALACTLPSGNGEVTVNDGVATITVQWDDSRGEDDPLVFIVESRI